MVYCLVWIYAMPSGGGEATSGGGDVDEMDPEGATIWVAANPAQIPDNVRPLA